MSNALILIVQVYILAFQESMLVRVGDAVFIEKLNHVLSDDCFQNLA